MNQTYLINQSTFSNFEDISINVNPNRILVFVKKAQDLDLRLFMGAAFYTDFIKYAYNSGVLTATFLGSTTALDGLYPNLIINPITGIGNGAKCNVSVLNGSITNFTIVNSGQGFIIGDTFSVSGINGVIFTVQTLDPNSAMAFLGDTPQTYLDLWNGLTYTDKSGNDVYYPGMIPALVYWTFARFVESDSINYTATGPVVKHHDAADALKPSDITKLVAQHRSIANAHANDIEMYLYNNYNSYPLWRFNSKEKNSRQDGARIRGIDKTEYNAPGYGQKGWPYDYNWLNGGLY